MVLGHESSGVIAAVGPAVTSLQAGDRVALEPGTPCRRCANCKAGKYNLCPHMAFAATPPFNGTLARYYVLPEDFCYKLPPHVGLDEGALMEPLGVAMHICRQAAVTPGVSVVVFGAGPVGLLCMAVAKAFGARKIVAVDIVQDRLDFAASYVATGTHRSDPGLSAADNAALIRDANELGSGADVAIDASGAEASIQAGIHVLRAGGTYVQGGNGKPDVAFPIVLASSKELTIKGSFRYGPGDYALCLEMLSEGKIDVKKLITGVVKFTSAEDAFKAVSAGQGIKTLIQGPE